MLAGLRRVQPLRNQEFDSGDVGETEPALALEEVQRVEPTCSGSNLHAATSTAGCSSVGGT